MGAEQPKIPEWAQRESGADRGWIRENVHVFWPTAAAAFQEDGRGAIVVDTTAQPIPGGGHPFGYVPQDELEQFGDEETNRLVRQYDPDTDFVVMLLKPLNRTSSYQLRMQEVGA